MRDGERHGVASGEGRRSGEAKPGTAAPGAAGDEASAGGTLRERIRRELAKGEPLSTHELSGRLKATERDIAAAIPHVEKSVEASGGRFLTLPPECAACGFVFQERTRATKPGRCPECRATRVRQARFVVEEGRP